MSQPDKTLNRVFAVEFKKLDRWDVKFFATRLRSKYQVIMLKPSIKEHNEKVNLFDYPDETFSVLGVNNKVGVFHAYDTKGSKINQPYKKVNSRDLVYNPYRVNVGSIGLVPADLDGKYISPAYVVFSVDERKILPEFLYLIMRSNWYNPMLRAGTAGSVRQNLTFDLLGSLQIPYSPIEIQKKILQHWQYAQTSIKRKYRTIETLKSETDKQFFRVLGLEPQPFSKLTKSFAVQWKNLMRWGVNYNQMAQIGMDLSKSKYKPVQLCSILSRMQYGTSSKPNTDGHGAPMIRMNNLVDGQLDLRDIKHVVLSERDKNNLLLKEGDILINRTNSKELVGKCAVFHEKSEFVFASYLIRMETNEKAEPDFVCYALNSSIGRQQIDSISRQIIGQANINTEEISSLQIPLPPIKVQRDFIQRCEEDRTEINRICENVELLSKEIEGEIEKLILGEKNI